MCLVQHPPGFRPSLFLFYLDTLENESRSGPQDRTFSYHLPPEETLLCPDAKKKKRLFWSSPPEKDQVPL